MPNSSSPPPSPVPIGPKPKQVPPDISALNLMPDKQKKTRDLPNLSDCHGCGRRINSTNPRERLQPMDSVWRIVLLCKKCRKQVNSGQSCVYCFKDVSETVSDCFNCANCHHLVHKNCIIKYENSAPCSFPNKVGQEITVCIDCWVPELLKRSIRARGKKNDRGKGLAVSRNNTHCESLGKDLGASRSFIEAANEAEHVQEKVAFAVKAKETGLMKAVAARSVVRSPNNVLDLAVKKNDDGKEKMGFVGNCDNGSSSNDSTKVVDDAELALQLHHAMNSSARILKNTGRMKVGCSDLLKISDSFDVQKKSVDFKHNGKDGKVAGCNTTLENRIHCGNILVEPTGIEANGSCTFSGPAGLKRELFTYKRNNGKKKKLQQSSVEASGNYTSTYSCLLKPELFTYKRHNRKKKKDSQESGVEANGICTCSAPGVLKAELVTYKRNNRKRKEHQQSVVEPNGSCSTIEIGDLKPELFHYEQQDGKIKECQLSGQEASGSCTFVYPVVSNPELVTYKRNRKRKECRQFGVHASESCNFNNCVGLNSVLVTYKRKNRKWKECEQCGKGGNLGFIDGSVEKHTRAGNSSLVAESHSSMQDEPKGECYIKDGGSSTPEDRITDFGAEDRNSNSMADICLLIDYERLSEGDDSTQGRSGNSYPGRFSLKYSRRRATASRSSGKSNCDSCLLKYGRRISCSGESLHGERTSAHNETNLGIASFQTEAQISALGVQTCCSGKHNTLSESSCDVNIEACSCGVGSSQGEA